MVKLIRIGFSGFFLKKTINFPNKHTTKRSTNQEASWRPSGIELMPMLQVRFGLPHFEATSPAYSRYHFLIRHSSSSSRVQELAKPAIWFIHAVCLFATILTNPIFHPFSTSLWFCVVMRLQRYIYWLMILVEVWEELSSNKYGANKYQLLIEYNWARPGAAVVHSICVCLLKHIILWLISMRCTVFQEIPEARPLRSQSMTDRTDLNTHIKIIFWAYWDLWDGPFLVIQM